MINHDPETGIAYGVISQNSLALERMDRWYWNDKLYDDSVNGFRSDLIRLLEDNNIDPELIKEIVEKAVDNFIINYQNDEAEWYYNDAEYEAKYSPSLNCWIILKSPYYTYCRACSPCVIGAGDLDSSIESQYVDPFKDKRAYCLPSEFFNGDNAPYLYHKVDDGSVVMG